VTNRHRHSYRPRYIYDTIRLSSLSSSSSSFICPIIQQYAHLHRYNVGRAGQQGPTRTLTAALKRVIKQFWGTYSYHTSKILQTRKLEKSVFSMLFPKTFKDAKFTVNGNAFQTFITLSTKNFCLMLAVHLGLNSL